MKSRSKDCQSFFRKARSCLFLLPLEGLAGMHWKRATTEIRPNDGSSDGSPILQILLVMTFCALPREFAHCGKLASCISTSTGSTKFPLNRSTFTKGANDRRWVASNRWFLAIQASASHGPMVTISQNKWSAGSKRNGSHSFRFPLSSLSPPEAGVVVIMNSRMSKTRRSPEQTLSQSDTRTLTWTPASRQFFKSFSLNLWDQWSELSARKLLTASYQAANYSTSFGSHYWDRSYRSFLIHYSKLRADRWWRPWPWHAAVWEAFHGDFLS